MATIGYLTTTFDFGAMKSLPTELEALGIRRPLLVTDAGVQSAGIAAQVLSRLDPAFRADPVLFADLTQDSYLPPTRAPNCQYEYKTMAKAFHKEIGPHIDRELAKGVIETNWLPGIA